MKRKSARQCDSTAAKAKRRKPSSSKPDANDSHGVKPKKQDIKRRSASTAKQSIKKVREQRKIERSKGSVDPEDEGRVLVAVDGDGAAPEDFFWEVEDVIGRRKHRGRVEYLIRWKGCSDDDNTWEPADNLCDTASEYLVHLPTPLSAEYFVDVFMRIFSTSTIAYSMLSSLSGSSCTVHQSSEVKENAARRR